MELARERSPLFQAGKIKKPLLIAQGKNDPRVKQAESDQMVLAMKANGVEVTYLLFPEEGHGFARPENNIAFVGDRRELLARHLGGRAESPTAEEAERANVRVLEGVDGIDWPARAGYVDLLTALASRRRSSRRRPPGGADARRRSGRASSARGARRHAAGDRRDLDEDVWKLTPGSDSFTQKFPKDGAPASDPTTVRVLYDDDAIYVGFDCPQPHTPVVEHLTRRDRGVEVDAVTFDLGTRGDHKSTFEFSVSSSGTLIDGIRFNDTDYSSDWDENWEARTHVTENGWTAEFRIPLRVLRFPTLPVQSWDFQVNRYISGRQESDDWAYFPRSLGGEVSHYGRLDGLEGLRERTPLELRPFVVGRVRRRDPAVGQLADGWDSLVSGGLDVKWHPTQALTLDATFNPDFAQVEADQVVLNLSTVETYYPEKRPFFLEGIDAYQTSFQLLYTRRIGHVPLTPPLRTDAINNEQLYDVPEPSAIYGASKLTGSLGSGWSVGTVQAVTAPNSVQVQLGSGARVSRLIDPALTFDVLRLKRDIGDNAHIAVMATAVTHAEQTELYPLQTPSAGYPTTTELCPNPIELTPLVQTSLTPSPRARCFNDAYVGAIDWRWRSPNGDYTTGGQIVASVLENGPPRPVADGTIIHNGDVGTGMQAVFQQGRGKALDGFVLGGCRIADSRDQRPRLQRARESD